MDRSRTLRLAQRRELPDEVRRALVTARVLVKIKLVVRLRIVPLAGRHQLCDNLAAPPLLVGALGDILRNGLLLRRVEEDGTAILGASVRALVVQLRRVVDGVQVLDQLSVRDLLRIEGDLQAFGICPPTRASARILSNRSLIPLRYRSRYPRRYVRPVSPPQTCL